MRCKPFFAMFVCALLTVGVGCASFPGGSAGGSEAGEEVAVGMPLAPDFRIEDIPLPVGFEFDRKASFVFQNSRMDIGKIQYTGGAVIDDVAQFYLDEMANYNWNLLNVTEHGTITMFFEKPGKAAQVLLTPKARGSMIQISFFPKSPTGSEF